MPTSVPNFKFLAPLVTEIWRGSQNKKWGAADLPRYPLAVKFLYVAIVPANACQHIPNFNFRGHGLKGLGLRG